MLWFTGLAFLVVVVGSGIRIAAIRAHHQKVSRIRHLQSIKTEAEAVADGWMWNPGGSLLPPDCDHTVPNGAAVSTTDLTVTLNGKIIDRWKPCPVKGFGSGPPRIDSR
jgi:hypothetical protein